MSGVRFLTADVPAIEGVVRSEPDDFVVDEVLSYEPSGSGTHLWFRIEKVGVTTFEVVRRLARALSRRESEFGYAGLKDRKARARQTLTIEHVSEAELAAVSVDGVELLDVTRHKNKLKLGHLRGNRFVIRVRGVGDGDAARAGEALAILERRGLPNFYGEQRFGRGGATPELGACLLREDWEGFAERYGGDVKDAERAVRGLPRRFLSLCTSSVQSRAFNRVLEERLSTLDEVTRGDVAYLHKNGACFIVEDIVAEAPRCANFEISPSGPMPGPSCLRAAGAQAALEARVLAELALDPQVFAVRRPWAQKGGRRALRVPVLAPRVVDRGADLDLAFELPRGSYATAVLAELFKRRQVVAPKLESA